MDYEDIVRLFIIVFSILVAIFILSKIGKILLIILVIYEILKIFKNKKI